MSLAVVQNKGFLWLFHLFINDFGISLLNSNIIFYKIYPTFLIDQRIIFNYTEYGDSPTCVGENLDIVNERALYQGFGVQPGNQEITGELLELQLKVISNEDCYQKLDNYIKTNINAYNVRSQIKETVYDGITDQLLCTEGKLVESCETNRHGERKCRNIYSVSKSKSLFHHPILEEIMESPCPSTLA